MTVTELFEQSLIIGLIVLVLLLLGGAYRLRPSRMRGLSFKEKLRKFAHYTAFRVPLALGFALAFFVLGAAGLTLNSHRPPGDPSPVVTLPKGASQAVVHLNLDSCEGDVSGRVTYSGPKSAPGTPRIYSDTDGRKMLAVKTGVESSNQSGFKLTDPLARRGLLSCYLQLPVVDGSRNGYEVRVSAGDDIEIDTMSSIPVPDAYNRGQWQWHCPPGESCPGLATVSFAIENGTKQVIVLVLASVFGALIALLVGEVLIGWAQRRFRRESK